MKHVHHDKIVAKAANMDLVLFNKSEGQDGWNVSHETCLPVFSKCDYFLCLPQHKEACLHWLNGGESQYLSNGMKEWINFGDSTSWSTTHLFMTNECELRIKPKKEKRWIGIHPLGATTPLGKTEEFVIDIVLLQLVDVVKPFYEWQFIEIEV